MQIVQAANQWAKAEMKSAICFMSFGVIYLIAAVCCFQLGDTPLTNALIVPMLVAGGLLVGAGISFYVSNKAKLNNFESAYKTNPSELITSELERTAQTMKTYENVALKVFPLVAVVSGLIAVFVSTPTVRAICIAVVAFLSVLILLDSQALKRIKVYHQHLENTKQPI